MEWPFSHSPRQDSCLWHLRFPPQHHEIASFALQLPSLLHCCRVPWAPANPRFPLRLGRGAKLRASRSSICGQPTGQSESQSSQLAVRGATSVSDCQHFPASPDEDDELFQSSRS